VATKILKSFALLLYTLSRHKEATLLYLRAV
jgi:hypothetical protein